MIQYLLKNNRILLSVVLLSASLLSYISLSSNALAAQNAENVSQQLLDDLFTIRAVKVDETARSAAQARTIAIQKAEREAYLKLLEKITQPADRLKLPELSRSQLQGLIRGIEIIEEQSSSRRYLATYDLVFEPQFVSDYLGQYNVPHVLSTGTGVAVIHGHNSGLTGYLWQPSAAIEAARDAIDWKNRVRSYSFPSGTVLDRFSISLNDVMLLNEGAANSIAENYSLSSALVIYSKLIPIENAETGLQVRYRFLLTDGSYRGEGILWAEHASETEFDLLRRMYRTILEDIDSRWREQLLVDTSEGGKITVSSNLTNAEAYGKITRILDSLSLVKRFVVVSLGLPLSVLEIEFTGRRDQLILALDFNGLTLEPYGEGWILGPKE